MTLADRFEREGREVFDPADPDAFLELAADLTRAHAAALGVPGARPKSVLLLACPRCGGRVLAEAEGERASCAAGCAWRGTVAEACS